MVKHLTDVEAINLAYHLAIQVDETQTIACEEFKNVVVKMAKELLKQVA